MHLTLIYDIKSTSHYLVNIDFCTCLSFSFNDVQTYWFSLKWFFHLGAPILPIYCTEAKNSFAFLCEFFGYHFCTNVLLNKVDKKNFRIISIIYFSSQKPHRYLHYKRYSKDLKSRTMNKITAGRVDGKFDLCVCTQYCLCSCCLGPSNWKFTITA